MIKQSRSFSLPQAKRVLVFAPHMDDESIGCGGILDMYQKREIELKIVFMTNYGNKYSKRIASIRDREAKNAMYLLNADSCCYNLQDNQMKLTDDLINQVYQEINSYEPDIIFAPYMKDFHNDHIVTGTAVTEALKFIGGKIIYYEVWTPITAPNCYINISESIKKKVALIECYQSQLKKYNLLKLCLSLNGYRAAAFPLKRFHYVEAFLIKDIEKQD